MGVLFRIRQAMVVKQVKKVTWFPAILLLVVLSGCDGFFVDPTLTDIAVAPPTPSLLQNSTLQMTAAGTYDDGNTKTITGTALWSTSDATVAAISKGGTLTGVGPGTASITASSGSVSGSTTVVI